MGAELRRETAWLTQNLVLSNPAYELVNCILSFVIAYIAQTRALSPSTL